MTFENPNYSRKTLEEAVTAVINRHDSEDAATSETIKERGNENVT